MGDDLISYKYFEYKQGEKDGKKVTCKVCVKVVHGGRTTNLKTHLHTWHCSTYDKIFSDASQGNGKCRQVFFAQQFTSIAFSRQILYM